MADVVSKTNPQNGVIYSVNTPNYSSDNWFINPVLPPFPSKYWKNDEDNLVEMNQSEKDVVDQLEGLEKETIRKINYNTVEDFTISQTTNHNFQNKLILITPILPSGSYELSSSWKIWTTKKTTKFEICLEQDGYELLKQESNQQTGIDVTSFTKTYINLYGSHEFNLLWRRVSGLGEVRISNAVFSLKRVI